jgi:hypothetical protein
MTARALALALLFVPATAGAFDLASLQPDVDRIIASTLEAPRAYAKLVSLCDGFGHRLSGSAALEGAIDWATETLRAEGFETARREEVMVPRWVRGAESASLVSPRREPLFMLGIGGSIGTPADGVTAEVVRVTNDRDLAARAGELAGKIVLYDNPMPPFSEEEGTCYGRTVRYRILGANLAAAHGARAVLVRSVTAHSLRTPHTGTLVYAEDTPKIPAAAISTEDADFLARLLAKGEDVRVHLHMEARMDPPARSANVVAEWKGRELPDEVVVVSGHIDSWDVGQGAHDDGAGVVMAMETLATLQRLNLRPRRTVRVVLWTNEENGFAGVKGYAKAHEAALPHHAAAIEADFGGFAPESFGIQHLDPEVQARATAQLRQILPMLAKAGTLAARPGGSGPDVAQLKAHRFPLLGLYTKGDRYFDYHHTHADTVDKVDPTELNHSAAALAALTWILAEMPGRLGDEASAVADVEGVNKEIEADAGKCKAADTTGQAGSK